MPRAGIYCTPASSLVDESGVPGQPADHCRDPNESSLIADGKDSRRVEHAGAGLSDITVCKNVGSNDATMSTCGALPWVGNPGTGLAPTSRIRRRRSPVSGRGGGAARARRGMNPPDVVQRQRRAETRGRRSGLRLSPVNEGQVVVTNGVNVGAWRQSHDPPILLPAPAGARAQHTVQAGQLRLQVGARRPRDSSGAPHGRSREQDQPLPDRRSGGLLDNLGWKASTDPEPTGRELNTLFTIESGEILLVGRPRRHRRA